MAKSRKLILSPRTSTEIRELVEKMFNFVWYARKDPADLTLPKQVHSMLMELERDYPEETAAIADPDKGDWQHGFNSGVLAALRYVLEPNRDYANQCWPKLDT
jgi:hypothetical protein